jgi:hypothetical protein
MLQAAKKRSWSNLWLATLQALATATAACRRAWGSMIELMYLASSSKCFLDILWLLLIYYTAIIQKGDFLVNHKKTLHKVGFTVQPREQIFTSFQLALQEQLERQQEQLV